MYLREEQPTNTKIQRKKIEKDIFDSWIEKINDFLDYRYDNEADYFTYWNLQNKIKDDKIQLNGKIFDCLKVFGEIADKCWMYGHFKDDSEKTFCIGYYGPIIYIKSVKTVCEYQFGFNEKGIYLSTHFKYSNNIRYMGDDFWKLLLSLSEFEGFSYFENQKVSSKIEKEYSELFASNKSLIFRMLRKYFFDVTIDDYDKNSYLGELEIAYSPKTDFPEIIENFCQGFKIMYRLNYMLWKVSDLKKKMRLE